MNSSILPAVCDIPVGVEHFPEACKINMNCLSVLLYLIFKGGLLYANFHTIACSLQSRAVNIKFLSPSNASCNQERFPIG